VLLFGQTAVYGGAGADLITLDGLPTIDCGRKYLGGVANTSCPSFGAPPSAASLVTGHETTPQRYLVTLDGQAGGDQYLVNATGSSDYVVNVHDSGAQADGVDRLTINGRSHGANVFLLRQLFVALMQPV